MPKLPNIDKIVLFNLPWILIVTLLTLPEKTLFFSTILIISLFIFELLIYKNRELYGFSGVPNLAIPSIIMITFTLIIAVPSIYVCSIENHPAIYPYFYSIIGFYIFYPLGLFIGQYLWKIDKNRTIYLYKASFKKSRFDYIFSELLILMIPVALAVFFNHLLKLDHIPLVELFQHPGDYAKLSLLREESYSALRLIFIERYSIAWGRSIIFPTGILASFFLYTIYQKKKYLVLLIFFVIFGLIFNSLTLEKSPVASIFLALIAFYYLRKKTINFKFILTSLIIVLAVPIIIVTIKYYRDAGLFKLIYITIFERIFITPTKVLYIHYKMFPEIHDFLMGRATNVTAWFHPDGIFPLSNYVASYWWKDPHTTGTLNAMFLAFFWADFGAIGVVISTIAVGLIAHWIYYKILQISEYSKNILFVVFSTVTFPLFTFAFFNSNFTILLVTRGVILLLILFILIHKVSITILGNKQTIS